jgi:archaellum component FlaC
MDPSSVMDRFNADVIQPMYETIDLSTRSASQAKAEVNILEKELDRIESEIKKLSRKVNQSPPPVPEAPPAELSPEQKQIADNLQRCLTMSSRMTACTIDSDCRLLCGGVVLKPGNSLTTLQANWDLIDTVTGADA